MKYRNLKKFAVAGFGAVSALTVPMLSHAALSAADETAILAGITGSETMFYTIGAAILVVIAGIWGFRKLQGLLGGK